MATNAGNAVRRVSLSAAAFVGGSYLPSMKAERLGNQMRLYRRLWPSFEAESDYAPLPQLYAKTLSARARLEAALALGEMTGAMAEPDYGSA